MLRRKNSGVVLVETAIILPLLLLLLFGIFEVYRMRVAEKFVDNVATSIAVDLSSRRVKNDKVIENIIKSHNAENAIRLMNDSEIKTRFSCNIGLQSKHEYALEIKADAGDTSYDVGDMIIVECSFKYEFLTQLTKSAFMGKKEGPLVITKRHFIKCL